MGVVALLSFLPGCWISSWFADPEPAPLPPDDELPDSVDELVELGNTLIETSKTEEGLARAAAALEKAGRLLRERRSNFDSAEIHIKLALACFLVSEKEDDPTRKLAWITKGEDAAKAAKRERPNRVEGYYYLALLKGRRIEQGGLGGIIRVRDVEKLGLKAAEIDPTFEEGGPYRLLAMLYAKAPPWPTSVGDVDLALEYAEKAIEIADYPLNHLFMAEALIEAEEFSKAQEELHKVLAAPKVGRWAREGEQWRPHARQLLRQLKSQ